jgi:hypothetical protein
MGAKLPAVVTMSVSKYSTTQKRKRFHFSGIAAVINEVQTYKQRIHAQ